MISTLKIGLQIPNEGHSERYFSLRLRSALIEEPSEYQQPEKIVVISDIEGNYEAFITLLVYTGVINKNLQWTFGDNHLVILGDAFDRGEQVIECIWLIYALEERAARKGGHVHFILGNHELMNLNGDWRYVHPKYAGLRGKENSPKIALYYGNNELWHWLCTKNIVEKIGRDLFVHGGIAPELLQLNLSVAEINEHSRPWYRFANEPLIDPLQYQLLGATNSPTWYRGYYDNSATEAVIKRTLEQYGADTIITGHTVVEKISCFFERMVINVDTDHANGQSEALIIDKNKYYRIGLKVKKTRIK